MPFICGACGRGMYPNLIPPAGDRLRCPRCGDERTFNRPPLLVVTGTVGIGKSTLCARLAGKVRGAAMLDADIFAEDLISVAPPNDDYEAFWRSMMRLAHELAQSNIAVVYFSVMRPAQVLANSDVLDYFAKVRFLCLTCSADELHVRLARREPGADPAGFDRWVEFNNALEADATTSPMADLMDAGRAIDLVERDVQAWIQGQLESQGAHATDASA